MLLYNINNNIFMSNKVTRKVTESIKKSVAGKQHYKCNNKPHSTLDKLDNYKCPLWKGSEHKGSFDESGYHIDHIEEWSINHNDSIDNLLGELHEQVASTSTVFVLS